jgi:hypothetical protein
MMSLDADHNFCIACESMLPAIAQVDATNRDLFYDIIGDHQRSMGELCSAAQNGCRICSRLRVSLGELEQEGRALHVRWFPLMWHLAVPSLYCPGGALKFGPPSIPTGAHPPVIPFWLCPVKTSKGTEAKLIDYCSIENLPTDDHPLNSTGGLKALLQAKSWLQKCLTQHERCREQRSGILYPTRLLEISSLTVRLIETALGDPNRPLHCSEPLLGPKTDSAATDHGELRNASIWYQVSYSSQNLQRCREGGTKLGNQISLDRLPLHYSVWRLQC